MQVIHFLFTCTSGEMRANHFDELLQDYHNSLRNLLDKLGGDTQSQFPFTAFLQQLKKFGKFGVIMAMFVIPMLTTKTEDLLDLDFYAENQEDIHKDPEKLKSMITGLTKPGANYVSRMKPTLLDLMRFGYI